MKTEIEVKDYNYRKRLDRFLQKELNLPYNLIMKIIRQGNVKVNGVRVKENSFFLSKDDLIQVFYSFTSTSTLQEVKPIDLKIPILYEDDDYAVVNKPAGLPVQGGLNIKVSLLNFLMYKFKTPFLVHRLDKFTSGIIVIAKSLKASRAFSDILREKNMVKKYLALLKTTSIDRNIYVELPVSGKNAKTLFMPKSFFNSATLMEIRIFTGRKHQIRIHASKMGMPIAGDKKYGDFVWNRELSKKGLKRIFLHSHYIEFVNPLSKALVSVKAPLSQDLKRFLENCNG